MLRISAVLACVVLLAPMVLVPAAGLAETQCRPCEEKPSVDTCSFWDWLWPPNFPRCVMAQLVAPFVESDEAWSQLCRLAGECMLDEMHSDMARLAEEIILVYCLVERCPEGCDAVPVCKNTQKPPQPGGQTPAPSEVIIVPVSTLANVDKEAERAERAAEDPEQGEQSCTERAADLIEAGDLAPEDCLDIYLQRRTAFGSYPLKALVARRLTLASIPSCDPKDTECHEAMEQIACLCLEKMKLGYPEYFKRVVSSCLVDGDCEAAAEIGRKAKAQRQRVDLDGDGLLNHRDNCMKVPNPKQINADGDDWGDDCDGCPKRYSFAKNDADSDGVWDECDVGVRVVDESEGGSGMAVKRLGMVAVGGTVVVDGELHHDWDCNTSRYLIPATEDVDFYEFTTPTMRRASGYLVVRVELNYDVAHGVGGVRLNQNRLSLFTWDGEDPENTSDGTTGDEVAEGESLIELRPAKPGESYLVSVSARGGCRAAGPYQVTVKSLSSSVKYLVDDDEDDDGLTNWDEELRGTDPGNAHSDSAEEGLTDGDEVFLYGTSPLLVDTDLDGMDDGEEAARLSGEWWSRDSDSDGLKNIVDPDSDGDGLYDGLEGACCGTDPGLRDTDGDGLSDGQEAQMAGSGLGLDPTVADSDGDGLLDGEEMELFGSLPWLADSDGDGLEDGEEAYGHSSDPARPDSSCDGVPDGEVVARGGDPARLDPNRVPIVEETFERGGAGCWFLFQGGEYRGHAALEEGSAGASSVVRLRRSGEEPTLALVNGGEFALRYSAYSVSARINAASPGSVRLVTSSGSKHHPECTVSNKASGRWEQLTLTCNRRAPNGVHAAIELLSPGEVLVDSIELRELRQADSTSAGGIHCGSGSQPPGGMAAFWLLLALCGLRVRCRRGDGHEVDGVGSHHDPIDTLDTPPRYFQLPLR